MSTVDIRQQCHILAVGPTSHEDATCAKEFAKCFKAFVEEVVGLVHSGAATHKTWSPSLVGQIHATLGHLVPFRKPLAVPVTNLVTNIPSQVVPHPPPLALASSVVVRTAPRTGPSVPSIGAPSNHEAHPLLISPSRNLSQAPFHPSPRRSSPRLSPPRLVTSHPPLQAHPPVASPRRSPRRQPLVPPPPSLATVLAQAPPNLAVAADTADTADAPVAPTATPMVACWLAICAAPSQVPQHPPHPPTLTLTQIWAAP